MREITDGARVLVMGLGRFGGGVGVTKWLARNGAHVLVTDQGDPASLRDSISHIQPLIDAAQVELRLGPHDEADFASADLIIANPAVKKPWADRFLEAARRRGVPITTEIRLVTERIDRRSVIGVTGSAGKSTTAAMVHHLLNALGCRAHLGGNFGGSLLDRLDQIGSGDFVVLELSSAMLYWLGEGVGFAEAGGWSPHVALITNIEPNHIDWHGSFEHYRESKENIVRFQSEGDIVVRSGDVPPLDHHSGFSVLGAHNRLNAALAIAAAQGVVHDIDRSDAARLLQSFRGLPHRLQTVAEFDGRTFINDSKSTTPEATVLAVDAFPKPDRVHLIVGGSDKGADLSSIARLADRGVRLYGIGATGPAIVSASSASIQCGTLERAVEAAFENMTCGDTLLLSPGCASFDQFQNFEARGERFIALVRRAIQTHDPALA